MLYPQNNKHRNFIDFSGFWNFKIDPENIGIKNSWFNGLTDTTPIAVPSSWNEIFAENRDFLGPSWYSYTFYLPWDSQNRSNFLRFGSVNYYCDVWLNGNKLGAHEGGHLPFEFEITPALLAGENHLCVRVDGNLSRDQVPPGKVRMNYPSTNYDFFPYCGIHRPVLLYNVPKYYIKDITVITDINEDIGLVNIQIFQSGNKQLSATVTLKGAEIELVEKVSFKDELGEINIEVADAALWSPKTPDLYELTIKLFNGKEEIDSYGLKVGIRSIEIRGDKLLLNGKPIYLKGFGRHEDFPIIGRGYFPSVIIKDYSLMKWIGANSFRTSHYPYSEQMMEIADELGFLIIDEIPAVGLTFERQYIEKHLSMCKQQIKELILRDKNHPSVIMWSLANEPHSSLKSRDFFKELYDFTKELDHSRPITVVNMQGVKERAFEFVDVLCLNRYYGWYTEPGQLELGCNFLSQELDKFYEKYKKPLILSEFGADTIPGWHSQPSEMFSEEFQVEFLKKYIKILREKPYIIGEHVWNLCDFKTSQEVRRTNGMNYKGVFTRERRPKMAAHALKRIWKQDSDKYE